VVISTVGPFNRLGHEVVRECVVAGTHYVDSTGEANFVKSTHELHAEAIQRGVLIISCTGFDSVPADIGALHLAEETRKVLGQDTQFRSIRWGSFCPLHLR
jgi:short subunit dehydrogenase-like uncharacterized protein